MLKNFMSDAGADFGVSAATGSFDQPSVNQFAQSLQETAQDLQDQIIPTPVRNAVFNTPRAGVSTNSVIDSIKDNTTNNTFANRSSAKTGNAPTSRIPFVPNLLDYYDVYTYHWKLFMVPMSASSSGNVLDTSIQSIIVESGVTDITIDKVEISAITTPSTETGSGTSTHVKFEIVEPSGAGLLDKMFYETISLGLGNWMTSPYYLQLEFRGRDPDTEMSVINGQGNGIGKPIWVWPITLSKAKINVTEVGTRYEFEAIMYDEKAQANAYFSLLHSVTLKDLTTFKDAMIDLENKLNEDAWEQLIDNYSIPDTYKIVVDEKLESIKLVNPDYKKNTQRASDWVDLSKKSATFTSGTSVDKIIDALLGSTSLGQMKVQDAKAPDAKPNAPQETKEHMKKLWRVITETVPIAYDAQRQNNANEITIFIVEYDLGSLQADAAQTGQTPDTKPAMKERLDEYLSKHILRKKYNYIFTGLNDQIKNLSLDMNYAFATATARFGGVYIDSAAGSTKGITMEENQENEKKAGTILRDAMKFMNDAPKDANHTNKVEQVKRAMAATKVNKETLAKYTAILEGYKPTNRTAYKTQLIKNQGQNQDGTQGIVGKIDPATNQPYNPLTMKSLAMANDSSALNFVSDVETSSSAAQSAKATAEAVGKGKLRPIPTQVAPQEGNFKGIDPAADAGRARTSSMFATALYSGMGADLQTIKMTIKGDPFWLFPRELSRDATGLNYKSRMSKADAIAEIKSSHLANSETANLSGTDNFIVLRFRTPKIFNDTTGSIDPFTEAEAFSGIYKTTRIISKFDNGRFVQELEAILDPLIDFASLPDFVKLLSAIESAVRTPEPMTLPQTDITIPTTSMKTDILQSNAIPLPGVSAITSSIPSQRISSMASSISNIPSNAKLTALDQISQQLPPLTP